MRLINTETHMLSEFVGSTQPTYAILSHTWGPDELTYQDWLYLHDQCPRRWGWVKLDDEVDLLNSKQGYGKIISACERSATDGYSWIWVDTVCIDKTNLAELSETINSMYKIYENSAICYVILTDVGPCNVKEASLEWSKFRLSRWFTRGWTLQELIAPQEVRFFARDWSHIDNRANLRHIISKITTIPAWCLDYSLDSRYKFSLLEMNIGFAQRMSWAASRDTTRDEDTAYCLLGIFGVSIPLLYGEGRISALQRLQEEVIRRTSDWGVFAWGGCKKWDRLKSRLTDDGESYHVRHNTSLTGEDATSTKDGRLFTGYYQSPFASHAKQFSGSADIPRLHVSDLSLLLAHTNIGLELDIHLINTMHPLFYFGVLPHGPARKNDEQGRPQIVEYWMPLVDHHSPANHTALPPLARSIPGEKRGGTSGRPALFLHRSGFPSALLSTMRDLQVDGFQGAENHIYLQLRQSMTWQYNMLYFPPKGSQFSNPTIDGDCRASILLAFPGPVTDVEFIEFWPPMAAKNQLLFHLSASNDDSDNAKDHEDHGHHKHRLSLGGVSLRHRQSDSLVIVLFAVRIHGDGKAKPHFTCNAALLDLDDMTNTSSLEARVSEWGSKVKAMLIDDRKRSRLPTASEVKREDGDGVVVRVLMHDETYKGRRETQLEGQELLQHVGYHYTIISQFIFPGF